MSREARGPVRYLLYTETFPSRDSRSPRQTGIGRYCHDLASGLARLGQEVVVLTNTSLGPTGDNAPDTFVTVATGEEPRSFSEALRRGSAVTRAVAEHSPDLLLVGDTSAHRVCSWLGPRLRIPFCPIFYGSELLGMIGKRSLGRILMERYLRRAAESICISRYTAQLLRRVAPEVRADCIVYPTVSELVLERPVDPAFSAALRSRVTVGGVTPIILLTIARISQRKNQLGVLQAIAQLHRDSATRFHYFILGNVDAEQHQEYRRELESFIESHALQQFVTFVPQASDEDKVAYLDACDVLVMLSRTVGPSVEGFGISAIEASCRGKPVIVGLEGGMPETIIEGRTGFAVPSDDIGRVVDALRTLAADQRLRTAMGEAGRIYSRTEFSPEVSARRLQQHLLRRGLVNR